MIAGTGSHPPRPALALLARIGRGGNYLTEVLARP